MRLDIGNAAGLAAAQNNMQAAQRANVGQQQQAIVQQGIGDFSQNWKRHQEEETAKTAVKAHAAKLGLDPNDPALEDPMQAAKILEEAYAKNRMEDSQQFQGQQLLQQQAPQMRRDAFTMDQAKQNQAALTSAAAPVPDEELGAEQAGQHAVASGIGAALGGMPGQAAAALGSLPKSAPMRDPSMEEIGTKYMRGGGSDLGRMGNFVGAVQRPQIEATRQAGQTERTHINRDSIETLTLKNQQLTRERDEARNATRNRGIDVTDENKDMDRASREGQGEATRKFQAGEGAANRGSREKIAANTLEQRIAEAKGRMTDADKKAISLIQTQLLSPMTLIDKAAGPSLEAKAKAILDKYQGGDAAQAPDEFRATLNPEQQADFDKLPPAEQAKVRAAWGK